MKDLRSELALRHVQLGAGRLPAMEGTGEVERVHLERYRFAGAYVGAGNVLDIATGIGYGAHFLATASREGSVTGVDISRAAIRAATERYTAANLRFSIITPGLVPFGDSEFDLVVSFETVEHTADRGEFLGELRRVLKPGGRLLISTPNRRFHSLGRSRPWNPHHAVEFTPPEFLLLLRQYFGEPEFWGGQEFLAVTPASVLKHNWVEMRYYKLLERPLYTALMGALREISTMVHKGRVSGARDAAGKEEVGTERESVLPWQEGREPYTMVAVCRKRSLSGETP